MLGRALYSPDDFEMRSTPAQYSGQRAPDLFVGWLRVLVQKSFCSQDHSADAVAALRSLLVDEGLLDRVRTLERSESLQRDDLLRSDCRHWSDARADGLAAGDNGARPALPEAATELRPIQLQIVPQNVEQRSCRIDVNRRHTSVGSERDFHVRSLHPRVSGGDKND